MLKELPGTGRIIRSLFLLVFLMNTRPVHSQADTLKPFSFSFFGELYYGYDLSQPANHERPFFLYNHKRHNEVNVNLTYVKGSIALKKFRANLGLMAGNYAQNNLSSEPEWARYVYEADMGIRIPGKTTLWLDAGIMPSHIGFESAVNTDCWTLTRSILAENSPYYETGIRLSYTGPKEKLNAGLMLLNGWQRIKRPDGFRRPAIGMQFNYKPIPALTLNYSNFIGSAQPDSVHALRVFHNLYAIFEPAGRWGLTAGFDIGTDKYNGSDYSAWFSPVLIGRYKLNKRTYLAARMEYYHDPRQIIIVTHSPRGFSTIGSSLNLDYRVNSWLTWRIEGRLFYAGDKIFVSRSMIAVNDNNAFVINITVKL